MVSQYGTQHYKSVPSEENREIEVEYDETSVFPSKQTFMSSVGKFAIGSIFVAAALVGSVALGEFKQGSSTKTALESENMLTTYDKMVEKLSPKPKAEGLSVVDEYSRRFGRSISDGMLADTMSFIVQIHKETVLQSSNGGSHIWKVDGVLQNDGNPLDDGLTYTFTETRPYLVEITDIGESYTVHAKRVRREIRDLTEEDRSKYFDAMKAIYSIDEEDGKKQFGENYHSAWWYVAKHLEGAADKTCDHWHDDAGIVTHHIAVTWELENSLTAVDSSVAAHYWDYTRDTSQADDGSDYVTSNIFNDDWFGPIESSDHPEHHIVNQGVFAYTRIKSKGNGTTSITNPYGLLRSPWNTNPTPYVMRHKAVFGRSGDGYSTFPACTDFQDYLSSEWVGKMFYAINGPLHGSLHLMTGGHWGASEKIVNWVQNAVSAPDSFLLFSKFLWRQGYIRIPEMCSADTPATECVPSCPEAVIRGRHASEILNVSGITGINNPFFNTDKEKYGISDQDLLDQLCSVGYPGELFTSAAPQDPLFWAIHGNAERFLSLARVLKQQGYLNFDETWGYLHQKIASDTGLVCDWTDTEGMEMPKCKFGETCTGHRANDLLPFNKLYDGQQNEFSNVDFYDMLSPANAYQLPYVYDSLLFWEGCTDKVLFTVDTSDST